MACSDAESRLPTHTMPVPGKLPSLSRRKGASGSCHWGACALSCCTRVSGTAPRKARVICHCSAFRARPPQWPTACADSGCRALWVAAFGHSPINRRRIPEVDGADEPDEVDVAGAVDEADRPDEVDEAGEIDEADEIGRAHV